MTFFVITINEYQTYPKVNLPVRTTELVDGFRHSAPYVNAHRG
ncbi:MAG: amino-acid N-acetyltransferase, partial [Shewanella psychromarinicola]